MKRIALLTTIVSILSIAIGFFYIQDIWFTFDFLGIEKGSEGDTVSLWGKWSIIFGALMLLSAGLNNTSFMKLTILLMFIIQLPPLFLWLMFGFVSPVEGLKGAIAHMAVFPLLILTLRELNRVWKRAIQ